MGEEQKLEPITYVNMRRTHRWLFIALRITYGPPTPESGTLVAPLVLAEVNNARIYMQQPSLALDQCLQRLNTSAQFFRLKRGCLVSKATEKALQILFSVQLKEELDGVQRCLARLQHKRCAGNNTSKQYNVERVVNFIKCCRQINKHETDDAVLFHAQSLNRYEWQRSLKPDLSRIFYDSSTAVILVWRSECSHSMLTLVKDCCVERTGQSRRHGVQP